jgi:hypothetical protein
VKPVGANVVQLRPVVLPQSVTLTIPLNEDRLRDTLDQVAVTVSLAQKILSKAETYGADAAIRGVHDVFEALSTLLH